MDDADASVDEAHIIDQLRRRDASAFADLVNEHQDTMIRVARQYVRDYAAAEDVVQETWLAVVRGIEEFEGRSSLKTWLYRILTNRAKTADSASARASPFRSRTAMPLVRLMLDSLCRPVRHGRTTEMIQSSRRNS